MLIVLKQRLSNKLRVGMGVGVGAVLAVLLLLNGNHGAGVLGRVGIDHHILVIAPVTHVGIVWTFTILLQLQTLKCAGSRLFELRRVTRHSLLLVHQSSFRQLKLVMVSILRVLPTTIGSDVGFIHRLLEQNLFLSTQAEWSTGIFPPQPFLQLLLSQLQLPELVRFIPFRKGES